VKFGMKIMIAAAALALSTLAHAAGAAEVVVSKGAFHAGEHAPADTASGSVSLVRLDSGRYELRLGDDFATTNGPDLFIYLSAAEDPTDDDAVAESDFVDAGKLGSFTGAQSFQLPDGFDPGKFKSVAVWCKQFSVLFGAAPLAAP